MKLKMTVRGVKQLDSDLKLRAKKSKTKDDGAVIVGHTANYALHVHERTDVPHQVGQAKFLETAYREVFPLVKKTVKKIYKATGSVQKGLFVAGLMIQRRSMQLTPIDTGHLRASAYTSKNKVRG